MNLTQFYKLKDAVYKDLLKSEQQRETIEKLSDYKVKISNQRVEVAKELSNATLAHNILLNWYDQMKNEKINQLQNDINNILKSFFGGNYNLKLVKDVVRNKNTLELIDENTDGTSKRSVKFMLSGAERQLAGFLVQATTLKNLGSNVLFLDESFSSFGEEEIKKIPDVLETLENFQIVIIEHKSNLFENLERKVVELESIDGITRLKE